MGKEISKGMGEEGFGADWIERVMRERIRETIEVLVEEELEAALGARRSERVGPQRRGYRHGKRERTLTTSLGPTTFSMPRARIEGQGEWRSRIVRRYQRRTERVDEALLGVYLSGTNTRRIRGALAPLLRGAPLSKDAISRLVGRLREDFETWSKRDLGKEQIVNLFLDGWYPRVRIGKKRVRVPVLVVLGTRRDGRRVVLEIRIAGEESERSWGELIDGLVRRNVGRPVLAVIDGHAGLERALRRVWPAIDIQRCTDHKL
jgi:transposase-like protein